MKIAKLIYGGFIRLKTFYNITILNFINKYYLLSKGISIKGQICLVGPILFRIDSEASVTIGENLKIVSSNLINPLIKNTTCFSISKGALLCIGNNVGMSSPILWIRKSLIIGNNVNIGANVTIMDSDGHSLNFLHRRDGEVDMANRIDRGIVIEDDVLVGMNSIILKGVHIGARSVIGAGSVVTKDIPSDCIAAGNPAKVIKVLHD